MSSLPIPQTPLKFIFFFLKSHLKFFFVLPVISFLWAVHTSLDPYLIKLMVDALEKGASEGTNVFYLLKIPVFIYISARIFMSCIDRGYDYFSLKVFPAFNKNVLTHLTKYIQKHSHSYFQNHFGGSIVSKISVAADTAEDILEASINNFIYPFFALCIAAVAVTKVSYILGCILLGWSAIFIWISYRLSYPIQKLSQEVSEKNTTLVGKLIDSVTNILAVRLFARRKYEMGYLEAAAQEKLIKSQEVGWENIRVQAVMGGMSNLLIVLLLYYLIVERQRGNITIGDFVLILTLSISIINVIWNISRNYIRLMEDIGKCSQALQVIALPYEIQDAPDAEPLVVTNGDIEFKKVTFGFQKERPLFNDFSIKIYGGEKIGVVGLSGSGKTTFANLIVQLFDIQSGQILIDGQDIQKVKQKSLHQHISFIPQEPMLFHRTIWENLLYGNLEATEEDIVNAAHKAHADQFISTLSEGYKTLIGERGSKLSGGQKQRIAITRSILKNSKILILDEATSALDSSTEYYIQKSLENLMQGKTVIAIAHRLSTLLKMDRLLVFENGTIAEQGKHAELLQQGGIYARLWEANYEKSTLA